MDIDLAAVRGLHDARDMLLKLLGTELTRIVEIALEDDDRFKVDLPKPGEVDHTIEDIIGKVALSSNVFGEISRLAGWARAQHKMVKLAYTLKYKANRIGKNDAERERNATLASEEEAIALTTLEAIIELAETLETAARMASESSRKMLGALQTMYTADGRENKFTHSASSYR